MKKMIIKTTMLVVLLIIAVLFSACLKNFDVSRLIDEPIPFEAPEVYDWVEKQQPPEAMDEYKGAYIDVNPIFGESLRIKGIDYVAQQIIEASKNLDRIVDIEPSRRGFKNKIKIYSADDALLGSFEFASDLMLYAREDKNSPLFLIPEYAYYTIEHTLLQLGSSLVEPLENWERIEQLGDERAQYNMGELELRITHDIKTILVRKYGLSEAYFLNYEIYTTAEYASSKEITVRVYALVGYAGYSFEKGELCDLHFEPQEDEDEPDIELFVDDPQKIEDCEDCEDDFLSPDYHIETAAKMVYTLTDGKYFRLTQYSEPAEFNEDFPSTFESRIRAIFPYEYMGEVMSALDDTSNIHLDIHRQALDYLRVSGQGEFEIED